MCGIVGTASRLPVADRDWLSKARDSMLHRGPDDAGEWWSSDGRVGLAHRRLSVIDLSAAGHQPMESTEHGLSMVFNGEIYNYLDLRRVLSELGCQFSSRTDTEAILAAYKTWGTECVSRLNGMFSIAIYDSQKKILFIARDRAGEKPLFYHFANGTLTFGSELKALLQNPELPARLNKYSLDCYLATGYVPRDKCILEGVTKLPPAHAMTFNLVSGEIISWPYWEIPESSGTDTVSSIDDEDLVQELENLLVDSVQRQLVTDVPVGILLSGGLDSSIVTALASRGGDKIRTFTVGFPNQGAMDETEHARLIATHFGTDHTELQAEPVTNSDIVKLARQFDEPLADSSLIPTYLVAQLVKQQCTVALGGDGGDELFGGYSHYSRIQIMQRRYRCMPKILRSLLARSASRLLPIGFRGRNFIQSLDADLERGLPSQSIYFDPISRASLIKNGLDWLPASEADVEKRIPNQADVLQRAMRMDFENYLPENILVKVDRASMLNSLEVRSPMLDYRLIEFAYAKVPSESKATTTEKKILLKKLAARILPAEFDMQRKQGFSVPLSCWLGAGPLRKFSEEVLLDGGSGPFSKTYIASLFCGLDKGYSVADRIFSLLMFELWREEYGVTY